jgi:hypothetical protein
MQLIKIHPAAFLNFKVDESVMTRQASSPSSGYASVASCPGKIVTSATIRVHNVSRVNTLYLLRTTVPSAYISADPSAGCIEPGRDVDVRVKLRLPYDLRRLLQETWTVDVTAAKEPAALADDPAAKGQHPRGFRSQSQVAVGWRQVRVEDSETVQLRVQLTWPFPSYVAAEKHVFIRFFLQDIRDEDERKRKQLGESGICDYVSVANSQRQDGQVFSDDHSDDVQVDGGEYRPKRATLTAFLKYFQSRDQ